MAQLVARYLGVVEAASSSLVTQTNKRGTQKCSSFAFSAAIGNDDLRCIPKGGIRARLRDLASHQVLSLRPSKKYTFITAHLDKKRSAIALRFF